MDLQHLRCYVAVAENLNFRRAAELLHLSQPALSARIKDLEDQMGVRLLDRNTGGTRLTAAGAVFLDQARAVLSRMEKAVALAREAGSDATEKLIVGYIAAASARFLPPALDVFSQRYPQVDVELLEMSQQDQIDAVVARRSHVGFTIGEGQRSLGLIRQYPLFATSLGVLCGARHRLASQARISLSQLNSEPILCLSRLHAWQVRHIFQNRGLKPGTVKMMQSFGSLITTLSAGRGVALMAELVENYARMKDVVLKPIRERGRDLTVTVSAMCRKGETRPWVFNFISVLAELA